MKAKSKFVKFLHLLGARQIEINEKHIWLKKKVNAFKNRSIYGKAELLSILNILFTAESPVSSSK